MYSTTGQMAANNIQQQPAQQSTQLTYQQNFAQMQQLPHQGFQNPNQYYNQQQNQQQFQYSQPVSLNQQSIPQQQQFLYQQPQQQQHQQTQQNQFYSPNPGMQQTPISLNNNTAQQGAQAQTNQQQSNVLFC